MKNTQQSPTPVLHEDSELTFRIAPSPHEVVLGAHAPAEALAEAKRLLSSY